MTPRIRPLLVAVAGVALMLPGAADAAVKRPDLLVQRLSTPPAQVQAGAKLKLDVTVANKGGVRSGGSNVRIYLSSDKKRNSGDVALNGSAKTAGIKRGTSARVKTSTVVPKSAAAGKRYVIACADGLGKVRESDEKNNCRVASKPISVVGAPGTGSPSSPQLPGGNASPSTTPLPAGIVHGKVQYTKRNCYSGPSARSPLTNATIKLVPPSGPPILATTDGAGEFEAQLANPAGVQAYAVLDGPQIAVGPDTSPYTPYEIPLGEVTAATQDFLIGGGDGNTQVDPASGAANIYTVLDRGARVAAQASPVPIPKVKARWRYASDLATWLGDDKGSAYHAPTQQIFVGGTLFSGARDEYEAFILLHEYAHHLLGQVADPPGATGAHDFGSVHVAHPELAWSEGFAHAFAGIAQGNPELTLGCEVRLNLGAKPATARFGADEPLRVMPEGSNGHLAQYNETAIAGSVWGVTNEIGLKSLLGALGSFKNAYHAPADLREVRDALTEFAIGEDADLQQRVGNAFDDHRLRWGFSVFVQSQVNNGIGSSGHVIPWARGEFCDETRRPSLNPPMLPANEAFLGPYEKHPTYGWNRYGGAEVFGSLTYTPHDDCWNTVRGSWIGQPSTADVNYALTSTLPHLARQEHRNGRTRVGLVYSCVSESNPCPTRTVTVRVGTGVWHRPGGQGHLDDAVPLNAKTVTINLDGKWRPELNDVVDILEIDALGYCRTLVPPVQDCST